MVYAVILPFALVVSGFAFLRFAVFLLFDLFSWLPVRSLPVGELSFAGPQGLPSRRRPWKASCLSCVGSRSWSLRLWRLFSCWLELPLLLALVVLFFLDFVDFLAVLVFGPFSLHFPSCGVPARWRDLRHVVLDTRRKKFHILCG